MNLLQLTVLWTAPLVALAQDTITTVQQSDTVLILGLAATLATVVTAAITSLTTILLARLNTKTIKLQETVDDTHTLVNSQMIVQLRLHADLTKRVAAKSGEADDIAAAKSAQELLTVHEAQQKKVDENVAARAHA